MARSRRRRAAASSGGWKKSKIIAYVLIGVIVIVWISILKNLACKGGGDIPEELVDFPYTYMTEESHKLIIVEGKSKSVPFTDEETGERAWEAYQCNFEECPARGEDGKPFIFPHVLKEVELPEGEEMPPDMQPYDYMEPPLCPACESEGVGGFEYIVRYQTEEGKKRLKKMQERLAKERD